MAYIYIYMLRLVGRQAHFIIIIFIIMIIVTRILKILSYKQQHKNSNMYVYMYVRTYVCEIIQHIHVSHVTAALPFTHEKNKNWSLLALSVVPETRHAVELSYK